MNLYDRDFSVILNKNEKEALSEYKEFYSKKGFRKAGAGPEHSHPNIEIRRFLWHYNSLFPNNLLWYIDLRFIDKYKESEDFFKVVDSSDNEQQIQRYIKENKKWFIPGSLYKEYSFGHHEAYLFSEIKFGAEFQADYCLLGQSSDDYSLVLIEFENANVPFTLAKQNAESESVRKGLTQIKDWKRWIDDNRSYFLRSIGLENKGISIPTSRIFYCLVVSRRKYLSREAIDLRSQLCYEALNLNIVSYDRIVDNIRLLSNTY